MMKSQKNIASGLLIIQPYQWSKYYSYHMIIIIMLTISAYLPCVAYDFATYLPLEVGNYWHFGFYWANSDTIITIDTITYSIINDSLINNNKWYLFDRFPFPMCDSLWVRWNSKGDLIYWDENNNIAMPLLPFASYVETPDYIYVKYKKCSWSDPRYTNSLNKNQDEDYLFMFLLCPNSADYICPPGRWYYQFIIPQCTSDNFARAYTCWGCYPGSNYAVLDLCLNVGFYFLNIDIEGFISLEWQAYLKYAKVNGREYKNLFSTQAINWESLKMEEGW